MKIFREYALLLTLTTPHPPNGTATASVCPSQTAAATSRAPASRCWTRLSVSAIPFTERARTRPCFSIVCSLPTMIQCGRALFGPSARLWEQSLVTARTTYHRREAARGLYPYSGWEHCLASVRLPLP
ncbi:hypothetical protein EJ03DRAFT_332525 [Teratosphaeria nubilosa]|uniref:Uncharacterized protein n=1 Tax=Teratosphaeria nubilosa TaxID=161662 RepID=A0A6G1KSW4_9PEZI|nr:hypothetical protein EJ03DRAFT_332525 [Teratosphaeria nubilosa]